jgi:hypothetical protein
VLGRVNDSSSHDLILFAFFAGEREDKDSRAEARCDSFPEKGNMVRKVLNTQKFGAKRSVKMLLFWVEILAYLVKSHFFVNWARDQA